ncbi:hypothetical protein PAMA_014277 [Pampus argenteus]
MFQSVWVTEEVMRRSLRFCSRQFPWRQRSFLVTSSGKDASLPGQQLAHSWVTNQSQTRRSQSFVSSVRFYSQSHNEELEEKKHFTSSEPSLPAETAGRGQRRSPFLDELQRCVSPSDVLDLTCRIAPTVQQISVCLNQMWTTIKKMSDEQQRCELQLMFGHPAFEKLLQNAMKSVVHMPNQDIAYSLLCMVRLGVSQNSRVVQTFLLNCQEKLNEFDERSLSIVASCLELMESSGNVDALKDGMRLVVENSLPQIKNVMTLQGVMRLLGKDAPLRIKKKLEAKAISMTDKFTIPNSLYMITTMAKMGFSSKPLLDICSKNITENISGIPFNRLNPLLQAYRELNYRDFDVLTGVSDYGSSMIDIWSNKQIIIFLSLFEDLLFCPTALMETFAEKVISNPDALTRKDILCLLKVYSRFNYDLNHHRQQFLDSLSQALNSYVPDMSSYELLKAVYYMCLLGHFPAAPLEKLLQSSTLEIFSTTAPKFLPRQERMFQTLHLCLRLDRPALPLPLTVPPSVLGSSFSTGSSANPHLSQALQSMLVDEADTQLQEMIMVENFYFVDGVITKPLPNPTAESSVAGDECSPAESSQRIAVICAPYSSFCYGTSNPCGALAIKIRHLKILGYNPVVVRVIS